MTIKRIYEIQDIGKGLITGISPDNLLLLNSEQIVPGLEEVLDKNSILEHFQFIDVNQKLEVTANSSGIWVASDDIADVSTPNARIGKHIGNDLTDVSLSFFPSNAVFRDSQNNKGLEYYGDYEANFTDRSLITKQYADDLIGGGSASSGAYSPTVTNVANTTLPAANGVCSYLKIGNIVTVSVNLSVVITSANTFTKVNVTLPPALNRATSTGTNGGSGTVINTTAGYFAAITKSTATNSFSVEFYPTSAITTTLSATFQYDITA